MGAHDVEPLLPASLAARLARVPGSLEPYDVGWSLRRTPGLRVEFRANTGTFIEVAVNNADGLPAAREVAGLVVRHGVGGPTDAVSEAVDRVGRALQRGDEGGRWLVPPAEPPAIEPPPWAAGELHPGRESTLLRRDFRAYEHLFGVAPVVLSHPTHRLTVLHYPAPWRGRVPVTGAVAVLHRAAIERRSYREYLGSLGFAVGSDGAVRHVPLPSHWREFAARSRVPHGALRPEVVESALGQLPAPTWLRHLIRGTLPISVAPWPFIRLHGALPERVRGYNPVDVGMPVHDEGVHLLAMHRVPEDLIRDLLARAVRSVRSRAWTAGWALGRFFEGPLTRAAQEAWRASYDPSEFDAHFAAAVPELERLAAVALQ